jgi:hypothetical protein
LPHTGCGFNLPRNIAGGNFGTIAYDLAPGSISDGFFFQSTSGAVSKWEIFVFDANGMNFTTICSDAADSGCGVASVPGPIVGAGLPDS